MRTMQEKALTIIQNTIAQHGFEPVIKTIYANTGHIGVQDKNAFGNIASIQYTFQDAHVSFTITVRGKKILSQPPRPDYFNFLIEYHKPEDFDNFIKRLQGELDKL